VSHPNLERDEDGKIKKNKNSPDDILKLFGLQSIKELGTWDYEWEMYHVGSGYEGAWFCDDEDWRPTKSSPSQGRLCTPDIGEGNSFDKKVVWYP